MSLMDRVRHVAELLAWDRAEIERLDALNDMLRAKNGALARTVAELDAENADLRRRLDGIRTFVAEENPLGRTTSDDGGQW